MAIKVLTLFAGAGGADIGILRAGGSHYSCIEGDLSACRTLQAAGFPAVYAWIGSVGPIGQPRWSWDQTPIDLLWASPPCQPYSQAGKRLGALDDRDGWPATLEVISQVFPKWIIIENVKGAPVHLWEQALKERGYITSAALLDAADWGLPSHRARWYLVAGPCGYHWPDPTHYGPQVPWLLRGRRIPWLGFGDALGVCGGLLPGNGGNLPAPREPADPAHTITAKSAMYLLSGPCQTITTVDGVGIGGKTSRDWFQSAIGRRRLTWQECAMLVGFPNGYPFYGTIEARYRQIGNAVAPIMAEVLVRALIVSEDQHV